MNYAAAHGLAGQFQQRNFQAGFMKGLSKWPCVFGLAGWLLDHGLVADRLSINEPTN